MSLKYKKIEFINDLSNNEIVELDEYDLIELAKLSLKLAPCVGIDEYSGHMEALRDYFNTNKNDFLEFKYYLEPKDNSYVLKEFEILNK